MSEHPESRFVTVSRVAGVVSAILLGVIAWTADRTYKQFDTLISTVGEINRLVAIQQTVLGAHDRRINDLESAVYPNRRPGG